MEDLGLKPGEASVSIRQTQKKQNKGTNVSTHALSRCYGVSLASDLYFEVRIS